MQAAFIVIYENASRNVHGINQTKTLPYTASFNDLPYIGSDINKCASRWGVKCEIFCFGFHYLQKKRMSGYITMPQQNYEEYIVMEDVN